MKQSIIDRIKDPRWRIEQANIYHIQTKERVNNRDVSQWKPFRPFGHQKRLNQKIITEGCRRVLVPKARRTGISTGINMIQLDACLNIPNFHSKIVDQTQSDATDKLVNRVQKAWEYMEDTYGDMGLVRSSTWNQSALKWSNGAMFTADTSGRGGSAVNFLHVSELGPIDFDDPKRADEIIDGAFPAADGGIIVVESTAKGPLGHFKRLCDNANSIPESDRTPDDWVVLFFAWHDDPRHSREGKYSRISSKTHEYLDHVQDEIGKKLTNQQRLWYHVMSETSSKVHYEYPSLLEECWEQPIEGAIYANLINKARGDGRMGKYLHEGMLPVYTLWDLGGPANTRCVFFQLINGEIRIVDAQMGGINKFGEHVMQGPETPADWMSLLSSKPYNYGAHILPHDGNIKQYHGQSFQTDLQKAGVQNVQRLQRRKGAVYERINETSSEFHRFVFNTDCENVEVMIKHLEVYHVKKATDGVTVKELPHADFSAHYADCVSGIVEAINAGKCNSDFRGQGRRRGRKIKMKAYTGS